MLQILFLFPKSAKLTQGSHISKVQVVFKKCMPCSFEETHRPCHLQLPPWIYVKPTNITSREFKLLALVLRPLMGHLGEDGSFKMAQMLGLGTVRANPTRKKAGLHFPQDSKLLFITRLTRHCGAQSSMQLDNSDLCRTGHFDTITARCPLKR